MSFQLTLNVHDEWNGQITFKGSLTRVEADFLIKILTIKILLCTHNQDFIAMPLVNTG